MEDTVRLKKSRYVEMQNTINDLQSKVHWLEYELRQKQTIIDAVILPLQNSGLVVRKER